MNKKITILLATLISTLSIYGQHKVEDLIEHPLLLKEWGTEGDNDANGTMRHYSLKNAQQIVLHKDGTLSWHDVKENKKYKYVIKNDTVFFTNTKGFWLKFSKDNYRTKDKTYIEFKNNHNQYYFGTLSETDSYHLFLSCLNRKRYKEAFDFLSNASEMKNPLLLCALAYFYEKGIGIEKDETTATITYEIASYYIETPKEVYRKQYIENMKDLAESGLIDKTYIDNIKFEESEIPLSEKQLNIINAFAHRKTGLQYFPQDTKDKEAYEADLAEVIEEFEKAVEANEDAVSMFMLGRIYYEGLLGFAEKERGMELLSKAANKHNIAALGYLAELYKKQGNKTLSKEYWQKAAIQTITKPIFTFDTISTLENPNIEETVNIEYLAKAKNKVK